MTTLIKILSIIWITVPLSTIAQSISFEQIDSRNLMQFLAASQNIDLNTATASQTSVLQYGNGNFSEITINPYSKLSALQLGDYNYLHFDNAFSKEHAKSGILVEGNNNIIDITGSNSISEKMQINLKANNMTIFMRNY